MSSPPSAPTSIAVAVVEYDDHFLIGPRPQNVVLAGLWEFPGGKVRIDETPEVAAARECFEEAGIVVDVGSRYAEVEHEYAHGRVRLHFIACTPRDPAQAPTSPFRWVDRESLADHQFPAANAALLARLLA